MLVQLLYFPGCPHVGEARRLLAEVLRDLACPLHVVEVDVTDSRTPAELRAWGSPTILVDGKDVAGGAPSGPSCRVYARSETPGVPPRALIEAAVRRHPGLASP